MSLNVLAYNLKRVMKIMGTEGLLKAMTALKPRFLLSQEVPQCFISALTRHRR